MHALADEKLWDWLQANVKINLGEKVPSENTFRRLLPSVGKEDFDLTKSMCCDQDVLLVVDESLDVKNRKVLNILITALGTFDKCRVACTKIVDRCNADAVVEDVLTCLETLSVKRKNMVGFVTDNAPYMITAGQRLKHVCPRMFHSTCWAHILHLQAEEIRSKYKYVDRFVACVKAALVKAPSRRQLLQDSLKEAGKSSTALPPIPVITRWGTWLQAVLYHSDNWGCLKEWISSSEIEPSSAVEELKEMMQNASLKDDIAGIASVANDLCNNIRKMEAGSIEKMVASDVWLTLTSTEILLKDAGLPYGKLRLYLSGKHPAISFWKAVQMLDPNKATSGDIPPEVKMFSEAVIPMSEIAAYNAILEDEDREVSLCPVQFWKRMSRDMPTLSKCALKALSFKPSSADVERSFSTLKKILVPGRSNLTDENLDIHLSLAFNSNNTEEKIDAEK